MIEIIDCEQGTPDWHMARAGTPTASEFHSILAKGKGLTRRTYMLKLAGELITGEPMEFYSNKHMERGHIMEPVARELYELRQEVIVEQVGFIKNGKAGYSPDGLVGNDGLVEIKSKLPHLQLDCLLTNEVPGEHIAQCQGGLWVSEREWIDFVSYWPGLPLFVKRLYRDEKYIKTLKEEIDKFLDDLNGVLKTVQAMN